MKKRIFGLSVCVILIIIAVTMTACSNEAELLQEQINTLEDENAVLRTNISSLRAELEGAQSELSFTQNELRGALAALEEATADEQPAAATPSGPLAITFYGTPHTERQWPLRNGVLEGIVGLYVDWNEFDDDVDISWSSTNENVITIRQSEDGLSATVTPVGTGTAEIVVTVGNQETRSLLRIT